MFSKLFKKSNRNGTNAHTYNTNHTKNVITSGADLKLNADLIKLIEEVRNNVNEIIESNKDFTSETLLNYVEAANTPVYRIKNANKYINLIQEELGFIPAKQGIEALYLSLITKQGFKFSTPYMFVIPDYEMDKLYILQHFYKWYSYKSGLGGFEDKTQRMFKYFLFTNDSAKYMQKLNMEQITKLEEAIARDREATDYVVEYSKHLEGSQKVLDKIKNDGSANI